MSGETTITIIGQPDRRPPRCATRRPVRLSPSFTIASSARTYNKQVEQWQDSEALFMRCSAWRDLGEHIAESLPRGTRVIASGRLRMHTYETNDGDSEPSTR
ncbi:single-stranded DNA-binding protein [Nonomuraea dietziae]|uniref:single-stranded DNA-binding protein n=1 Tax=Nonomuraea dietziae TaxID=65515 RepID=UPI0031E2E16B